MSHSGTNHDAHFRSDRDYFVVKLHLGVVIAFQNEVGLRQLLVVVKFGINTNLCNVNRAWVVTDLAESTSGLAAWAIDGFDLREINDFITGTVFYGHTVFD